MKHRFSAYFSAGRGGGADLVQHSDLGMRQTERRRRGRETIGRSQPEVIGTRRRIVQLGHQRSGTQRHGGGDRRSTTRESCSLAEQCCLSPLARARVRGLFPPGGWVRLLVWPIRSLQPLAAASRASAPLVMAHWEGVVASQVRDEKAQTRGGA